MQTDREKVINSILWKFLERIGNQSVSFVVSVVLARLLLPEQYGIIAMVNVFILFSNIFITSGFTSALVQKKDADDTDFSTVFFSSLVLSICLYILLWLLSPYIADYFAMPQLKDITRIYALSLVLSSYNSVQVAYVNRNMLFRKNLIATLISSILSGFLGIAAAYLGFGVWALVLQGLLSIVINIIVLHFIVSWRLSFVFSIERFHKLISFGGNILLSDLVNTFVNEVRSLLIGKYYTPADLAFFNRGNQLPNLVSTNLDTTIQSVLFPAMSNYSNDRERVKAMTKRAIKTSTYLTFFFMTLLAVSSEPIIRILLTDRWIDCVPYMQIICISRALGVVSISNLQGLKAIGESKEILKLEVFKKPLFLILIVLSVNLSVLAVAVTMPMYAIYALAMNSKPTRRLLNYGIREQLIDIAPSLLLALAVGVVTYPITFLQLSVWWIMFLQILLGFVVLILLSIAFKVESYYYILEILKNKILIKR